jgi:hypothetical protein
MYFNLKTGVSEDEFVKKLKDFLDYLKGKIKGVGPEKLYRHHVFGANPRTFQTHIEFKEFGARQT